MLILAGISIAAITGENGVLKNAQKAKIETRGATVEEARDLWRAAQEADKESNSPTVQTREEVINELVKQNQLTEEEKDIILGNEEKGIEAKYEITIGSRTIDFKEEKDLMKKFYIKLYNGEELVKTLTFNFEEGMDFDTWFESEYCVGFEETGFSVVFPGGMQVLVYRFKYDGVWFEYEYCPDEPDSPDISLYENCSFDIYQK